MSKNSKISLLILVFGTLFFTSHLGQAAFLWSDYYDIVSIPSPNGVDSQVGGLALNSDGQLTACFHRGEVMVYDAELSEWKLFASGLHEPLGIYVEEEGTILVIQRSELTRLHDTDRDGLADFYELVSNDWGMTGNYHEFTFGLVKDSKKNIYISLGTASSGSGVREEIRGKWNPAGGLTHEDFLYGGKYGDWKVKKVKVPRMYSRVPYRGCVLRIEPGSSKAHVYATGFRTPNGLFMDADDQLWVSDNQGDWVGASKLHRVVEGGFHGHAASLLWSENPPDGTPADLPVSDLDAMRIKAAGLFPQGYCANSMTQILPLRKNFSPMSDFGSAKKPLIVGEMNHSRLVHYLPDVVNGQAQGAGTHLLNTATLGMGNNRLVYSPDGKTLYLGKTHLSWAGREGLTKVTYNGKPYLMVESVRLTPHGFEFTFNASIENTADISEFKIESYRIAYQAKYGSKKNELESETCSKAVIKGNILTLELSEKPKANRVYDITLPSTITSELSEISSNRFWYTAHQVY